ncbi:hypothetical protein SH2C18_49120 [Clostridium sediminicola]|uniref:PTS sugar transporter subunit IIA n=1 Tax=Clostridium sediminicola TaxID=3114879 RepID=UPI0031F239CF
MEKIINENLVELNLQGNNKTKVIEYMASLLFEEGRLSEKEVYIKEVLAREELASTAVGFGVGIPHGKCDAVKIPSVVFGRCKESIMWDSQGEAVRLVFLLAVPKEAASDQHLKILAALSRKLMDEDFINLLLDSRNKASLLRELSEALSTV